MKLSDHLSKKDKEKLKKKREKLSEKDLRDLMGTNRPTYKRSNGAIKNRWS